ncbi:hypothetical protein AUQ42_01445 [Thalassospira sp. MCCC 1A02491]|nr:hypothetical protein AUQ42_01445 [Thalassospira sp. MCCC 1A02491]
MRHAAPYGATCRASSPARHGITAPPSVDICLMGRDRANPARHELDLGAIAALLPDDIAIETVPG